MEPQEMRESSQKKFMQLTNLLQLLQVTLVAKQKITQDGFVEMVVVFNDNERYPEVPATVVPENTAPEVVAPVEGPQGNV